MITDVELKRWKEDGRLPIKRMVNVRQWGKTLATSIHSAGALQSITPRVIAFWRAADLANGKARKPRVIAPNKLPKARTAWGFDRVGTEDSQVVIRLQITWLGQPQAWLLTVPRESVFISETLWIKHWSSVAKAFATYVDAHARLMELASDSLARKPVTSSELGGLHDHLLAIMQKTQPDTWVPQSEDHAHHYFAKIDKAFAKKQGLKRRQ